MSDDDTSRLEARIDGLARTLDEIRTALIGSADGTRLGLVARVAAVEAQSASLTSQVAAVQTLAARHEVEIERSRAALAVWGSLGGILGGGVIALVVRLLTL